MDHRENCAGAREGVGSDGCCGLLFCGSTRSLKSDAGAIGLVEGSLHMSDGRLGLLDLRSSMLGRPERRFCVLERLRFSLAGVLELRRGPTVWLWRGGSDPMPNTSARELEELGP